MFFSLYQSQNISSLNQSIPTPLPESKCRSSDVKEAVSPQKDKGENGEVSWIRKKHNQFEQFNSLTPINISLSYNINKKRQSNLFLKDQIVSNRKSVQQNPQNPQKQKKFHSESLYLEQKRRKSQYSKFFNQTLVDNQHNFIGKSYLRQVKNCKVNPKNVQSALLSPQKIFLPKRSHKFIKETYFTPFSNGSTTKVFECRQRSESLIYLNKKLSLNERFSTQKSMQDESLQKNEMKNVFVSKILIKQIQDKVKNDIKKEMKTLKNLKLNKFKLKNQKNSEDHSPKKTLYIQKNQKSLQAKQKRQSQMSSKKNLNLMTKYSDSDIKFRQHFKSSKVRKLQTSVQSYQDKCYKVLNEHSIQPIPEDLRPWDSENLDFFEFR